MARTVRNAKLDTRSARSKLPQSKSGYWVPMAQGCALGYRKGVKGGRWVARMIRDGEREERTLGEADDYLDTDGVHVLAYGEAQEVARAWFSAPKEIAPIEPPPVPHTVGIAADEYLEAYRAGQTKGGGKGLIETVATLDAFIRSTFGDRLVTSLTKAEIEKWHRQLAETPPRKRRRAGCEVVHHDVDMTDPDVIRARRASANRVLTVLKAVLNRVPSELLDGKLGEWVHVKPFREVDAPTIRWMEQAEAKRLLNAAAPDLRRLATGALLTGARYSELARFRAQDFSSTARGVHVRKAKGQKPRFIHLTEEGVRFFAEQCAGKEAGELIFRRAVQVRDKDTDQPRIVMEPWGKSHQIRPIAEASEAAKISPAVGFHILRHTYASWLAMKGVPLTVIAQQLGHADTRLTETHYAHLAPSYVGDTVRAAFGDMKLAPASNVVSIDAAAAGELLVKDDAAAEVIDHAVLGVVD